MAPQVPQATGLAVFEPLPGRVETKRAVAYLSLVRHSGTGISRTPNFGLIKH